MTEVFICDAVRTPFGRYGGALSSIRTDDLATLPIKALIERNPSVDWGSLDDVIYGCVNQAGEDNRNVARIDRKSTRLNSSHGYISYAVFCLKKKKKKIMIYIAP